ncbi:MAG: hypothetical protein Q9163_002707 [Psora crenata]
MLVFILRYGTYNCSFRAWNHSFSTTSHLRSDGALNIPGLRQSFLQKVISGRHNNIDLGGWCQGTEEHGGSRRDVARSDEQIQGSITRSESLKGSTTPTETSAQVPDQSPFPYFEEALPSVSCDLEVLNNAQKVTGGRSLAKPLEVKLNAFQERRELVNTQAVKHAYKKISRALESRDSQGLLREVWNLTRDDAVIASIPATTFVEILRQFEPCEDFLPFRYDYKDRIPKHYSMLTHQKERRYKELECRRIMYWDISHRRVQMGRQHGIQEYKYLLRCARGTWDGGGALRIMQDMMDRNIQPDLACYNYYFEARCWSDAWYPDERQRLRVFGHTQKRREQISQLWFRAGVNINPHKLGQDGLKAEVTRMFTHMIESGTVADAKAYGHLVTALGREGDMQGVKAVLKRAWNVDVDTINDAQDIKPQIRIPKDSPLYPDQSLLFIIAHAFGSNNDVSTALTVVDHFSRKFTIPICQEVCEELLEWAYTLSTPRSKKRREEEAQLGQLGRLSVQTVENLWDVLISEPYCCEPTLAMYDVLIRSFRRRDYLFPMLRYMLQAYEIHLRDAQQYQENLSKVRNMPNGKSSVDLDANAQRIQQELNQLREKVFVSFVTIHKWFSLLLTGQRFLTKGSRVSVWQRQLLPNVVDVFWRFRDTDGVQYNTETGRVLLRDGRNQRSFSYLRSLEHDLSCGQIHSVL